MALTAELTRLVNNVRVNIPGVVDSNIQLELFNTLNEFFTDSKCWLNTVTLNILVGVVSYTVTPADPGTPISLMYLQDTNQTPVPATMQIPGTVVLQTTPTTTGTYTAQVALTVVDPADSDLYPQLPSWVLKKYYAVILSGVLSKLMMQPSKPYTNERMSVFNTRKFRSGIAVARAEARHQNLYGGQTWAYPTFATGRQR